MTQNDKTCVFHSISQELYLIWLWFLIHLCTCVKWCIYCNFFHFFQNSEFLWFLVWGEMGGGGEKGKQWPIITNFSPSHSISKNCRSYHTVPVDTCNCMCTCRHTRTSKFACTIYHMRKITVFAIFVLSL